MISFPTNVIPCGYTLSSLKGSSLSPEVLLDLCHVRAAAWEDKGLKKTNITKWQDSIDKNPDTLQHLIHKDGKLIAAARSTFFKELAALQDSQYYLKYKGNIDLPVVQVTRMAVVPDHQNQGLAESLFQETFRAGRWEHQNAKSVVCDVSNKGDLSWLSRLGFAILGETGPQEGYPQDLNWLVVKRRI